MKELHVWSLAAFTNMMATESLDDSNVETKTNCAFVCINNPGLETYFKKDHPNVLNLHFDDVNQSEYNLLKNKYSTSQAFKDLVLFNDELASRLYEFYKANKDAEYWYVHCYAGVSRSGAVGVWLCNMTGYPVMQFLKEHRQVEPNMLVLKKLREVSKLK